MARILKQVVNQYGTGLMEGMSVRCVIQWVDDSIGEKGQELIDYDDMTVPQQSIYNNYKNMVEKFVSSGHTLQSVVNQHTVGGVPARSIVQWFNDATGEDYQAIENRNDMDSPDGQIFDTYETQCNNLMIE